LKAAGENHQGVPVGKVLHPVKLCQFIHILRGFGVIVVLLKKLNFAMPEVAGPDKLGFFVLLVNCPLILAVGKYILHRTASYTGPIFPWWRREPGLYTGSEDPSNQLASPPDLLFVADSSLECIEYSQPLKEDSFRKDKDRRLWGRRREIGRPGREEELSSSEERRESAAVLERWMASGRCRKRQRRGVAVVIKGWLFVDLEVRRAP